MRTPRPQFRSPLHLLLLAAALLVLAACSGPEARQTTIIPQGDHAQRIYDLLLPIFWMGMAVFVVVEGLLIYTVLRFRRRSNAIPAQIHGNTRIEILWTIAPALIVLVIAVLTFRTQMLTAELTINPQNPVEVTAVGHQWWFEFRYPGLGEGGEDLVTASDMYIPVGRPVRVTLQGADVIHNFWVPKLAGKTYMIPGKTNYLAFTAAQPGIYRAVCAEFCGEAHALMRFRVIAVPEDEFQRWVEQRAVPPSAAAPGSLTVGGLTGDPARGQEIFLDPRRQCISCHAVDGTEARGVIGPNLTYYGSRLTIAAGILPYSPENLSDWLHRAYEIKPGNLMSRVITPQWIDANLSEQDIADLVAYLDSMKLSVNLPPEN
ncbi:MAG: cytochrome c oxidase subunit II [Chloroflexota bacterium]|mgnify:CR=1 FL=1|nr:MAG: cytochrome c oxidase subunit II [Chloroflexota bacterium]